jgi:hypothetical protein
MSETDHAEEPAERNADYCYFFNAACRTKGVPNGIVPVPFVWAGLQSIFLTCCL